MASAALLKNKDQFVPAAVSDPMPPLRLIHTQRFLRGP
jgi:hypothetical protein